MATWIEVVLIKGGLLDESVLSLGKWISANESMSEAASSYQLLVRGQKAGKLFLLNGVKFDGVASNTLIDAKSDKGNFVNKSTGDFAGWFKGKQGLLDQTERQTRAANDTKIQWYFQNIAAMEATQKLIKRNGIEGIELIYKPK